MGLLICVKAVACFTYGQRTHVKSADGGGKEQLQPRKMPRRAIVIHIFWLVTEGFGRTRQLCSEINRRKSLHSSELRIVIL